MKNCKQICFDRIDWHNLNQAQHYDLEHYSKNNDLSFWVKIAKKARGSILEIGCGTGRVTLPILENGINVYGIDKSLVMIEELIKKTKMATVKVTPHLFVDDMKTFDLKKRFDLIICPFNTFLTLLSNDEREAFLTNVYHHLRKGGLFIFDVIANNTNYLVLTKKWRLEKINKYPNGYLSKRYFLNKNRNAKKTINIEFKTELFNDKGKLIDRWFFDYFIAFLKTQEIIILLEKYGFSIETIYGDYKETKLEQINNLKNRIFVARKDCYENTFLFKHE